MNKITYAGHSAVLIELSGSVIAVDPWLKGNPLCPETLYNPDQLDIIVLTHGHPDHASDVLRLWEQHRSCSIVATYELAQLLIKEGIDEARVVPMNKGGTYVEDDLAITLTHAMHSNSFDSTTGTQYAGEACGVVLKYGTHSIYHAGDTALFGDMELIGRFHAPTIGLLPIGDRFTMGPVEAAEAVRILNLKTVIPIHYNTFPMLTGTPGEFEKELKNDSVQVVTVEPGQSYTLS